MIGKKMVSIYEKHEKAIAIGLFLIMCISFIPVGALSLFNHPTGDDYYYGYHAMVSLRETGSVFFAIKEAFLGMIEAYNTWQGTYSAMFLMHIPPHVFGDVFYRLYPIMLVIFFSCSIFYFLKAIICDYIGSNKYTFLTLASVITFLCVNTIPNAGEGIYWYNGAMYYTGFFACTMFFWGLIVRFVLNPRLYRLILLCILAFFISGGNYVSLLPSMLALSFLLLYLIYKQKNSNIIYSIGLILTISLVGFALSALAPGNDFRKEVSIGMPAWKAILKSIYYAFFYIKAWSRVSIFVGIIICLPAFIHLTNKLSINVWQISLIFILSFGVYASMACPTLYAEGSVGHPRCFNLSYFVMILFIFESSVLILKLLDKFGVSTFCFIAILFTLFVGLLPFRSIKDTYTEHLCIRSTRLLLSGEASEYDAQYQKRLESVKNASSDENITWNHYTVSDDMRWILYVGDFSSNRNDFNNVSVALFYNVQSISVK